MVVEKDSIGRSLFARKVPEELRIKMKRVFSTIQKRSVTFIIEGHVGLRICCSQRDCVMLYKWHTFFSWQKLNIIIITIIITLGQ